MQVKIRGPRRTSGKQGSNARSTCPISMALELIGDPWSLLIVRDLMFKGRHRYKDFLEAEEGIASNVLADRLRRLESAGIIGRAPDPEDGRRALYSLTKKGIELAPVLVDLVIWSAKHHDTGAPTAIVRLMRDQRDAFLQGVLDDWNSKQKGKSVPGTR
jgi:DNA-binding HxlR family transcriptional regulator